MTREEWDKEKKLCINFRKAFSKGYKLGKAYPKYLEGNIALTIEKLYHNYLFSKKKKDIKANSKCDYKLGITGALAFDRGYMAGCSIFTQPKINTYEDLLSELRESKKELEIYMKNRDNTKYTIADYTRIVNSGGEPPFNMGFALGLD